MSQAEHDQAAAQQALVPTKPNQQTRHERRMISPASRIARVVLAPQSLRWASAAVSCPNSSPFTHPSVNPSHCAPPQPPLHSLTDHA